MCKECGGSGICEHGRQRSQCKECGGASICEHGRHAVRSFSAETDPKPDSLRARPLVVS